MYLYAAVFSAADNLARAIFASRDNAPKLSYANKDRHLQDYWLFRMFSYHFLHIYESIIVQRRTGKLGTEQKNFIKRRNLHQRLHRFGDALSGRCHVVNLIDNPYSGVSRILSWK